MRKTSVLSTPILSTPAFLALVLALGSLAACNRSEPAPEQKAQEPAAAAPAPPLTYKRTSPDAEVSLELPAEVGEATALYAKLYSEGRNTLDAFAEGATAELADLRAAGAPARQLAQDLNYKLTAETPKLIGLELTDFQNTGGAHPNTVVTGLVWDKAAGRLLEAKDLFRPGADLAKANAALCDAIHTAKAARKQTLELSGDLKACPAIDTVSLTLAPSDQVGRAGGLIAVFSPYVLGPYSEGAYRVTVPNTALQGVLAPAYEAGFLGTAPPNPAGTADGA